MDMDLRIILLVIGALIIIGLIVVDRIKRKKRQKLPYRRFSASDDFELPSMTATSEAPDHDELGELHVDDVVSSQPMAADTYPEESVEQVEQVESEPVVEVESEPEIDSEPGLEQATVEEQTEPQPDPQLDQSDEVEQEQGMVLSLLLLAPKGEKFRGSQLKMALKETGFSYGKMDIFHRMEGDESLVSVANVLEPGTFDLDEMTTIKTPGVVIFSQLPASRAGGEIFTAWYTAVKKVNASLGGRLATINRMPLEDGYIEKLRQQAEVFAATEQVIDE